MPAITHDRRRVRTAIRATALFDGTGVAPVADPVVLVEDGRITDVQSGPRAAVPADAELIELPGATLLPGLIDTHVHLAFDASPATVDALAARDDEAALDAMATAAAAQLSSGVTTVRDLGDRNYLAVRLRAMGDRHQVLGDCAPLPTIVAAGPPITTGAGHCHFLGGAAEGVDGVRAAVREHVERGVDVIKVMASGGEMTAGTAVHLPQYPADELRALVEEAHRLGLPVTAHAHSTVAIADALAARVDGIEHCSFRTADGVYAPAELINGVAAQRVAVGATLGGIFDGDFAPPAHLLAMLPLFIANLRRLHAAGALIVVGTDAGIAPTKPHGVLPHGLEQLTQLGMSNADALRAGTSVAAAVCGLGGSQGPAGGGLRRRPARRRRRPARRHRRAAPPARGARRRAPGRPDAGAGPMTAGPTPMAPTDQPTATERERDEHHGSDPDRADRARGERATRPGRVRAALRKVGWWIVDGMATDNGFYWTLSGTWVPTAAYAARIVAEPDPRARLEQRGMHLPPC